LTEVVFHTEEHLLEGLRAGSEDAFTAIYGQYWERLFFVAHKRLQSAEDAREVVQDVFLTLWQKRASLEIQSLPLYLSAMTRYAVYRQMGLARRKTTGLRAFALKAGRQNRTLDVDSPQLIDILVRLSHELPEKQRLVFIHHKLMDRPLEEVAEMLGVSLRTAEGYSAKVMEFMRRHRQQLGLSVLLFSLH
jgi:RNA polymerase sigma-70 factor (ECF subfamily)